MRLIFIRHGEPDYEHDTLTEKGWREAECLASRVEKWKIDEIFCSPLGRALDTARPSLKRLGREAVVLPWLEEFRGKIKNPRKNKIGVPWDFFPDDWTKEPLLYDKDNWPKAPVMQTGPVEEVFGETCRGIDSLLAERGYVREGGFYRVKETRDENLVFFCHQGITLAILAHLLGVAAPVFWQGIFLPPTSVTIAGMEEVKAGAASFRCQGMGDVRHLAEHGEPISPSGYFMDVFQG